MECRAAATDRGTTDRGTGRDRLRDRPRPTVGRLTVGPPAATGRGTGRNLPLDHRKTSTSRTAVQGVHSRAAVNHRTTSAGGCRTMEPAAASSTARGSGRRITEPHASDVRGRGVGGVEATVRGRGARGPEARPEARRGSDVRGRGLGGAKRDVHVTCGGEAQEERKRPRDSWDFSCTTQWCRVPSSHRAQGASQALVVEAAPGPAPLHALMQQSPGPRSLPPHPTPSLPPYFPPTPHPAIPLRGQFTPALLPVPTSRRGGGAYGATSFG